MNNQITLCLDDEILSCQMEKAFSSKFTAQFSLCKSAADLELFIEQLDPDDKAVIIRENTFENMDALHSHDVTILSFGGTESDLPYPFKIGNLLDLVTRHYEQENSIGWQRGDLIQIGNYVLVPDRMVLCPTDDNGGACKDNAQIIKLTEKEQDILLCLAARAGHIIDRSSLLDSVWGYSENIETHTLETHIYRLRQKIEKDPSEPVYLVTEGTGYKLMD